MKFSDSWTQVKKLFNKSERKLSEVDYGARKYNAQRPNTYWAFRDPVNSNGLIRIVDIQSSWKVFVFSLMFPSKRTNNSSSCAELTSSATFLKLKAKTSSWMFCSVTSWTASTKICWNARFARDLTWLSMHWRKIFTTALFCRLLYSLVRKWTLSWYLKASSTGNLSRYARSNLICWSLEKVNYGFARCE